MAELTAPHRIQIPLQYLAVERRPLSAYDDNPVRSERSAAAVIGVTAECMKKWRQRDQGPDYLQYGPSGPVRYELSSLMEFRAAHRVRVSHKL